MNYEFIKVEKKGHVTTVTINRPKVMNSISPLVSVEMDQAFNDFDADPQQWICIITGAGEKAFSAGNDLKFQAENGVDKMREIMKGVKGGFAGLTSRFDCYKPFIAAVNGLALGGGFEIALACDIIVASETASFGLPEPRVGLILDSGGVHRLPRQIPYHIAQYYDHDLQTHHSTAGRAVRACGRSCSSLGADSNCGEDRGGNSARGPVVYPGGQGSDCKRLKRYSAGRDKHAVPGATCHASIRRFY
jgi:enoyl-CoA hydratase/carnithine racemase